jgi:hypothetical protein
VERWSIADKTRGRRAVTVGRNKNCLLFMEEKQKIKILKPISWTVLFIMHNRKNNCRGLPTYLIFSYIDTDSRGCTKSRELKVIAIFRWHL